MLLRSFLAHLCPVRLVDMARMFCLLQNVVIMVMSWQPCHRLLCSQNTVVQQFSSIGHNMQQCSSIEYCVAVSAIGHTMQQFSSIGHNMQQCSSIEHCCECVAVFLYRTLLCSSFPPDIFEPLATSYATSLAKELDTKLN